MSVPELFDTHCHIDDSRFDADREDLHARMAEAGVTRFAVIGTELASSRSAIDYARAHGGAVAAVGFYPGDADAFRGAEDLAALAEWAKEPEVRALGEIGLDYHWPDNPSRETQRRVLSEQLELAWELGLPCCFHVRDAHPDMIEVLRKHRTHLTGGIMHCFSGSWETAQEYLRLGYHISFAGPVTFRNARKLHETAAKCPAERILIETDSPYMAPEPVRGRRNEPTFVRHIAERIAELRGIPYGEAAALTTRNACRVYGLPFPE
ncbi:MAG: TatD family hydrolase [Clostridia bacterium]|nr:TatD family hydrolase [Clostridia bacterium]